MRGGRGGRGKSVCNQLKPKCIISLLSMHILTETWLLPLPAVLYRKVVSYLLLRSGLGSATDIAVVREASGEEGSTLHVWSWYDICHTDRALCAVCVPVCVEHL